MFVRRVGRPTGYVRPYVVVFLIVVIALLSTFASPLTLAAPQTSVVAWGNNDSGQRDTPPGLSGVTAIAAGNFHSLALRSNGTVVAWGCGGGHDSGQCAVPPGLSGVVAIAAGIDSLALKSDGTVVEWGCTLCAPANLSGVIAIATGGRQLALKNDGTVVEWGDTSGIQIPTDLSGVTAIAVGGSHDLALKNDGTVVGWGNDFSTQSSVPPGLSGVTAIAAGPFSSLALLGDGTARGWGCSQPFLDGGQCRVPAGLSGLTALAGGGLFSLALKRDGTVAAWGCQLGDFGQCAVPLGLSGVVAISAGGTHSLALVTASATRLGSLNFNGSTSFAEVPATSDLNITGDWTIEAWFKDEDPNGFNHDFRQMLIKGDRNAATEAPYYMLVGRNSILAGVRSEGQDFPIVWNLVYEGLDPHAWHHAAASFNASLNVLNLWLDGKHIAYLSVPTHSATGNSLPLEIGRNGPTTGKYWLGKLDDVRIWKVARKGVDITANYRTQLNGPQTGLVANWYFDEDGGTRAADSAGAHHDAFLSGGAIFSTDVHP
jgi:hypothetical protein